MIFDNFICNFLSLFHDLFTFVLQSLLIGRYLSDLAGGGLYPAETGARERVLEAEGIASVTGGEYEATAEGDPVVALEKPDASSCENSAYPAMSSDSALLRMS